MIRNGERRDRKEINDRQTGVSKQRKGDIHHRKDMEYLAAEQHSKSTGRIGIITLESEGRIKRCINKIL